VKIRPVGTELFQAVRRDIRQVGTELFQAVRRDIRQVGTELFQAVRRDIRPVGTELLQADRKDGQTDRHDAVYSRFWQFCGTDTTFWYTNFCLIRKLIKQNRIEKDSDSRTVGCDMLCCLCD